MIEYIRIQRFKCFSDITVQFKRLTLFTGENSTGKSTIIQSLLLLRQAHQMRAWRQKRFPLNGPWVKLGTEKDALCHWAEDDSIEFTIGFTENENKYFHWKISTIDKKLESFFMKTLEIPQFEKPLPNILANRFFFISADRLGPQLTYPPSEEGEDYLHVGIHGEYTAHCLYHFRDEKIALEKLANPEKDKPLQLSYQLNAWMSYILHGIIIKSDRVTSADILTIGMENRSRKKKSLDIRPTNMGFGISYCMPIVVSALLCKQDTLLIVENPEAHLHPKAQSRLGLFLARASAAGAQVVIETHSDHLLNGIRIAVKKGLLKPHDVSINFVDEDYEIDHLEIDSDGRIDDWPPGFFDQMENDLQELI